MGVGVVNLLFTAAFVLLNPVAHTWGLRARVKLQNNGLSTELSDVSHELIQKTVKDPNDKTIEEALDREVIGGNLNKKTVVNPASTDRDVVQKYLDRKVVEEKIKEKWEQLKKGSPKAVTEEAIKRAGKLVTFERSGQISLKEAFQFMQYYPLLYGEEKHPTEFRVPIGSEFQKFKLANKPDGTFSLKAIRSGGSEVDLSDLKAAVNILSDSKLKDALKKTLNEVTVKALDAKLNDQPDFDGVLKKNDDKSTVSPTERDEAFRAVTDVLAGTSIQRNKLLGLNPSAWLQKTNSDIESKMEAVRKTLSEEIAAEGKTKLRHELVQSMLKSSQQAIDEWNKLKITDTAPNSKQKIVEENLVTKGKDKELKVTIHETDKLSIKDIFRLLQFYPDIYKNQGLYHTTFEVPLGGKRRKFRLSKSNKAAQRGEHQIVVTTSDKDWPGTTKRGEGENGVIHYPRYDTIIDEVLKNFPDHSKLSAAMLKAVDKKLNSQPDFSKEFEIKGKESLDTTRATVEFMICTMVAEAAQPKDEFKADFLTKLAKRIRVKNRFPERIPSLSTMKNPTGRSPALDEAVKGMLENVGPTKIEQAFNENNFPSRVKGGAAKGRVFMNRNGGRLVPSYLIRKRAAGEYDGEVVAAKVAKHCTGTRRRRKRFSCSLNEKDSVIVDEESIKITEDQVEFDIVDRRNAKDREHVRLQISSGELAFPELIVDLVTNSRRAGPNEAYSKVNKGLAVHGLIFSVLGAVNYFQEGDNLRAAISMAQSAHTLGGLTGINEIVNKVGKRVLSSATKGLAKGLNLEKGLEKLSSKMERFAERGVGELLGDIPVVGLAFDIYFIEQDIEQLADLNLNDPEDLKLLPLRVIDLGLDVSTTVLNLIGTLCPAAEVITEPLVIVLSIIRMAIDDFYIDIMMEMEKVNWKSPWAGLEFLGALVKGFLEGAADFLTGGLRRQMESYRKQENYDKKLIQDLKNSDNYYKIVGEKKGGGGRIDFTQGKLSSFGGYINFRLHDNNRATLEIGDVSGSHNTIRKTFQVGSDVRDIVLGIGESRTFEYKHKTAKLWFVIPIKSYSVICGAKFHEQSVYGTYYGNSKNNTFYAVQKPKPTTTPTGKKGGDNCNFGKLNLKLVTGKYHYNLYGRGGSDTFYLGPEMSRVTGGSGSDLFVIQSDGGKTVIDNFAVDNKRDIIFINVEYGKIRCYQSGTDLDISYSKSHHIRIKNWFKPGDPTYYRHVSFRSLDGVFFVPKQTLNSNDIHSVQCVAVALDLSAAKAAQTISLNNSKFTQVKQVSGSNYSDNIIGNDVNNILDGGNGADYLTGGKDEDTYIIRVNEGCDIINNDAADYFNTTDVLVFEVPFDRIEVQKKGYDLFVNDRINAQSSCFTIRNWTLGYRYRHILFTSGDHVVFNISTREDGSVSKVPIMLDYKTSATGICVDLSDSPSPDCIKPTGYTNVATISDSPHNDHMVGNAQTNFLSCTGGEDYLEGGEATDNYVVKKTCHKATINNFDSRQKIDVVYLEETFMNLKLKKDGKDLKVISSHGTPTVVFSNWFESPDNQHLGIRTIDGITLRINSNTVKLEPYEVSKDPNECRCTHVGCNAVVNYDLNSHPWHNVLRFVLKSSHCSYKIYGNKFNNYLDPGAGNGFNYQHLEGRNGSDTYVLNHGYGEFNEINNYADDSKTDTLRLGLEFDDICVYFHGRNDVILASNSRPDSLSVLVLNYFLGAKYQHLQVTSVDKVVFNISKQYPYKKVIAVDRRIIDSPQNIDPQRNSVIASALDLKGSLTSANNMTGTDTTREMEGGAEADILRGGQEGTVFDGKHGNDTIYGGAGNDIVFCGYGHDVVYGGAGDDYVYGGEGSDIIRGGNGSDTLSFKGDGFLHKGVTVDLNIGFGKGADAEGDIYESIENVYGTIHNDVLIGSDSGNELYGLEGDDTLSPHGGNDKLVGGEGKDLYLLYNAWGLKIIDNFANDQTEDTLSLAHLNSADACVFLLGDDLYIQIDKSTLASVLFHGRRLTIIIKNWNVSAKYSHLKVLFNDTLWEGYALWGISPVLEKLENNVYFIETRTNLELVSANQTSVTLSWNQPSGLLTSSEGELYLVHFKQLEPTSLKKTQLQSRASITVSYLDPTSHYVFAVALSKCNATIAVSHTLITYGRERSCSLIQVPHSTVNYTQSENVGNGVRVQVGLKQAHGTIASLKCYTGYTIRNHQTEQTTTCLDQEWVPSLAVCKKIKRCPVIAQPSNGEVSIKGQVEGSKAHYVCHKGFFLKGPQVRTCVTESWDGTVPSCHPLRCPSPPPIDNGSYLRCDYIKYTKTYGTMNDPLAGYCVKLKCSNSFLPSHIFYGKSYRPRWESDWKIPQGGRVCSDGKWIGYVDDTCEPIARLVYVGERWSTISGFLQLWQNGGWTFASSTPTQHTLILSCRSVGIESPSYVKHGSMSSKIFVTCSKLRFTQPKPTVYEGRVEMLNQGVWEGLCVTERGTQVGSKPICEALGFNFRSAVVSISTGWTDHWLDCKKQSSGAPFSGWLFGKIQNVEYNRERCYLKRKRQHCSTMVRCRQRCTDSYPVPHGYTTCSETSYEDDTCAVHCHNDYKLKGDSKVYCHGGVWTKQSGKPASSHCEDIDTLFRNDLQRLVRENSKMSHRDLAIFLRNYLDRNYPKQYWVVTVYDPVKGFDKHTFADGDRVGSKLRYYGVNYVVFRYPKYASRSPRVPISRVIGSVTGSDAKTVWSSIDKKFAANLQRYAFLHVIRKIKQYLKYYGYGNWKPIVLTNYYTTKSESFPSQNYFYKEFPNVIVIAVAPGNYI